VGQKQKRPGCVPGRFVYVNCLRCLGSREAVTTADGSDLQVQGSIFGMTAFVNQLQICLMAGPDADKNIRFVVFAEVRTETALSTLN
jgi:hypothetical protein